MKGYKFYNGICKRVGIVLVLIALALSAYTASFLFVYQPKMPKYLQ